MRQAAENISLQDAERRIFVQVASQVGLTVRGDDIFRELQKRVLRWGFDPSRNLRNIPNGAWEGDSFEIDQDNSEHAEAVRLESPSYWAFRLRERLKDTSRIWTTEVGIGERSPTEAVFGCRLICSQRGNTEPIPRSVPNFVRGIAFTQEAYLDGRRTSPEPWVVDTEEDVDELVAFIVATYGAIKAGKSSRVHVRPVAGQPYPTTMDVECSRSMQKLYPVGTRFRICAKETSREGGTGPEPQPDFILGPPKECPRMSGKKRH